MELNQTYLDTAREFSERRTALLEESYSNLLNITYFDGRIVRDL